MRTLHLGFLVATVAACEGASAPGSEPGAPDASITTTIDAPANAGCPVGKAGASCILAIYDRAVASCDTADLDELRGELDRRRDLGPLWAAGRALFRTAAPRDIAGGFNNWAPGSLRSIPLCDAADLVLAVGAVPSGSWPYKLVDNGTWSLDPLNPAFAYDDFEGNADGANSLLVTPDSGKGQLVRLPRACSTELGNCRDVTAYLPPGYDALEAVDTTYPVLFMHDGQAVWDDHDCCFGHTGWELNVALDTEIAANRVRPIVVIAAAHSGNRNAEYGLSRAALAKFMAFQVDELQPQALARVRWNGERVAVAGSSLGGLVSMHLALAYPQTYAAAASLSGAFWPGTDEGVDKLVDKLPTYGKQALAIYLDHGGNPATNSDGAADSIEVRDTLANLGWQRADSPACVPGPDALCYFAEPGATHDELAWKARTWRFLRFLFPR